MSAAAVLNASQQEAYNAIMEFMFTPGVQELVIDGSAGTGKTTLIRFLDENLLMQYGKTAEVLGFKQEYTQLRVTATTRKAVTALKDGGIKGAQTIHVALGLRLLRDSETGRMQLSQFAEEPFAQGTLVVVDECSMINRELYGFITKARQNRSVKLIYVGDRFQLPPVSEPLSPVYLKNPKPVTLSTYVRQKHPDLMTLAETLKHAIATGCGVTLRQSKHVRLLDEYQISAFLRREFSGSAAQNDRTLITCYTNAAVHRFSTIIMKDVRHCASFYDLSEKYICDRTFTDIDDDSVIFRTEEKVRIVRLGGPAVFAGVRGLAAEVAPAAKPSAVIKVFLPYDYREVEDRARMAAECGQTDLQYKLESILRLRIACACTVHKAQGTTVQKVLVNLTDIARTGDPDTVRRLTYVAATRAEEMVYFYGDVPYIDWI